jgi:hypothetical protein
MTGQYLMSHKYHRFFCTSDVVHMLGLIKAHAKEAEEGDSQADANELWKVGAYICILTAASLR